jgi:hypothetical protein
MDAVHCGSERICSVSSVKCLEHHIYNATVDPNNTTIQAATGYNAESTHINFGYSPGYGGIPYIVVDSTAPPVPINVYDYSGQSDVVVEPVPATAPIESAPADRSGWPDTYLGDEHLLLLDRATCCLYPSLPSDSSTRLGKTLARINL